MTTAMSANAPCRAQRGAAAMAAMVAAVAALAALATAAWADPMRPLGGGSSKGGKPTGAAQPGAPGFLGGIGGGRAPAPATTDPTPPGDGSPASAEAAPKPPEEPRLVALRQDSLGQWHALYDGRWLTKGDKLARPGGDKASDESVVSIDGQGIRLRQGRQTRDIHLLPQLLPSRPVAAASSASSPTPRMNGSSRASSNARPTGQKRP
ncbi:MAG: hypothetical protein LW854_19285 [Rubrivivax sp.]|jgi:hypothetical protein|nr:hypothetical protein [Rubrivivax sp.]